MYVLQGSTLLSIEKNLATEQGSAKVGNTNGGPSFTIARATKLSEGNDGPAAV